MIAMDKHECTHLVLGSPGGKKHKFATKWGLTITSTKERVV